MSAALTVGWEEFSQSEPSLFRKYCEHVAHKICINENQSGNNFQSDSSSESSLPSVEGILFYKHDFIWTSLSSCFI